MLSGGRRRPVLGLGWAGDVRSTPLCTPHPRTSKPAHSALALRTEWFALQAGDLVRQRVRLRRKPRPLSGRRYLRALRHRA